MFSGISTAPSEHQEEQAGKTPEVACLEFSQQAAEQAAALTQPQQRDNYLIPAELIFTVGGVRRDVR